MNCFFLNSSFQLTFPRVLTSKQDFPLGQGNQRFLLQSQGKVREEYFVRKIY